MTVALPALPKICFKIFFGVYSGRLIEVRASALVSDADDARAPVQPARRESRLAAEQGECFGDVGVVSGG